MIRGFHVNHCGTGKSPAANLRYQVGVPHSLGVRPLLLQPLLHSLNCQVPVFYPVHHYVQDVPAERPVFEFGRRMDDLGFFFSAAQKQCGSMFVFQADLRREEIRTLTLCYGACGFGQGPCQPSVEPPLTSAVLVWAGHPFETVHPYHRKRRPRGHRAILVQKPRRSADTPGKSARCNRLLNEVSRLVLQRLSAASLESAIR